MNPYTSSQLMEAAQLARELIEVIAKMHHRGAPVKGMYAAMHVSDGPNTVLHLAEHADDLGPGDPVGLQAEQAADQLEIITEAMLKIAYQRCIWAGRISGGEFGIGI